MDFHIAVYDDGEAAKAPKLSAEQGYFTRANKSKFTGEAGFAVVDASGGLSQKAADLYIRSVGEAVVFDIREERGWLYATLPSREDGRLSVTRAFPTSDGRRACHFSHTFLFDEDAAKEILRDKARYAYAARLTGFCDEYVGEPVGLGRTTARFTNEPLPEKTSISDTGLTESAMLRLINLIALLHENRGNTPNFLRHIFIVYDCEAKAFKQRAFALSGLLYAYLPYIITSKLGIVIKTDAAWRKADSYPSGYQSAYDDGPASERTFVPGGELYILNHELAESPANAAVFTIGKGGVNCACGLEPTAAYARFTEEIVRGMKRAGGWLYPFYHFITAIVDDELSFRDMCNFFTLSEMLREPREVDSCDQKQTLRLLRLLNAAFGRRFDAADSEWRKRAEDLVWRILNKEAADKISEDVCVQLLEAGVYLFGAGADKARFVEIYYCFLVRSRCLSIAAVKLIAALNKEADILSAIARSDAANKCFVDFRNELIERGGIDDFSFAVKYLDIYGEPDDATELAVYGAVDKLFAKAETKRALAGIVGAGDYSRRAIDGAINSVKDLAVRILELKSYNAADYQTCSDFFANTLPNFAAGAKVGVTINYPLNDGWYVKWLLYQAWNEAESNIIKALLQTFTQRFNDLLKTKDAASVESIKEYKKSLCKADEISKGYEHRMLIMYADLSKPVWTIDWEGLVNSWVPIGSFDIVAKCIKWLSPAYTTIDNKLFDDILTYTRKSYQKKAVDEDYAKKCRAGLMKCVYSLVKGVEQDQQIALLMLAMYGYSARKSMCNRNELYTHRAQYASAYCKNCHAITPYSNNEKPKCVICEKPISFEREARSVIEVITIDCATADRLFFSDVNKKKKGKDHAGGGKFSVKAENDIVSVTINGVTQDAERFVGQHIELRNRRTCIVLEGDAEDYEVLLFIGNRLAEERFSCIVVTRHKELPPGLPSLRRFTEGERSRHASIDYVAGQRPDDMITETAHALVRMGLIDEPEPSYYGYGSLSPREAQKKTTARKGEIDKQSLLPYPIPLIIGCAALLLAIIAAVVIIFAINPWGGNDVGDDPSASETAEQDPIESLPAEVQPEQTPGADDNSADAKDSDEANAEDSDEATAEDSDEATAEDNDTDQVDDDAGGVSASLNKNEYRPGEAIVITYDGITAEMAWIGAYIAWYAPGTQDSQHEDTRVLKEGKGSAETNAPSAPGNYEIRLVVKYDDGTEKAERTLPFTVLAGGGEPSEKSVNPSGV